MELFRLLGTIAVDNSNANRALDETARRAGSTGEEVKTAFNKIGKVAGTIAKGIGTAALAIGGSWVATIESTREYREEMGKLDTAFQTAGHSSETAKQTYSDLNAVLGDSGQATEAAQHLAKLTDNEKDLQTWTDICTGVYATFGESIPIESLTESANEVAKNGELTGGLVDALVWAGIGEEEFQEKLDACTTEQERQELIMNTLNGTYKEASDQYKKTNKDVMDANRAQEKLTDAFAELGRVGEPILTAIKTKVADMVSASIPHIESFIEKIKDIKKWIKDNKETFDTWVAVITGAGVAIGSFLLILNWGAIMAAAANAVKTLRLAILAVNAAMRANPIGIVISVIAGLVAAFIYLWNNVDGFRAFWINAWELIKKAASASCKAITKFFLDAWETIKKTWSAVSGFFKGVWDGISKAFSGAKTYLTNTFKNAWNGVKSAWNSAKSFFSGLWSSISGVFSNVGGWFRDKFNSAWSSIKSVFSGWGSFFGGLWTQIKSKFSSIGSSLGASMGGAVKSAMNKVLSTIEKSINKGIGLINSAIKLANKLPGINVGTLSKISLPRLERGGVLKRGQIGILEGSGAEAVVPLENNRAWISRLAVDLNEMQGDNMRESENKQITTLINKIIAMLEDIEKMQVYLDSGALVGAIIPAVDVSLSDRWRHSMRGNVR